MVSKWYRADRFSLCALLHTNYKMCLSVYTYFLHPCWWCLFILCLCVCVCSSLARRWFLSAAQTRELILPKGLTVDLVTVAIFAYSSSSCTSSSSSSLNLPHALSTSNIQVGWAGSGVSLATHTECKSMYFFFFHLPLYAFPAKFPLCWELFHIQICFIGTTGEKPVLLKKSM